MEAALLGGFIKVILPRLFSLIDDKYKLHRGVKSDVKFLVKELRMIVGAIDDDELSDTSAAARLSIQDLRELAHGIEDCIDGLMYRATWEQQASFLRRSVRLRPPKALKTSAQLAREMQRLRQMAREAHERKQRYAADFPAGGQPSSSATPPVDESPSSPSDPRILDADLVGVDEPIAELLEQLAEVQPSRLKVIAVVGFCGLGKTALAAEVYNRETRSERFERHAWVYAALKSPREVLADLLRKLSSDAPSCQGKSVLETSDVGQLCAELKQQLVKKRYFIVIDDIRTEDQWKTIKSALPADKDISSRILVTTTIQSVANACSSSNGYVHKMSRLDKICSKQLLTKKACPDKYSCYKQPDPAEVLKKCDGQPLALVTIGEFLQAKGWPTGPSCEDVCTQIGYHLENDKSFEKMRRVLIHNYTTLPSHALKACLLYFGMFPSNRPIRKKSLLRRWLAEGFVEPQPSPSSPDPIAAFNALMDRNIIEPINLSNNDNVKTCQTYGMMREFILHMSVSQNFVTLFCNDKIEPKYVRRLSLHESSATDADSFSNVDLSLVRSLAIFGKASQTVLDLSKYHLLRVLDLEKCEELKDDHVKDICNLLLLKYLSLGAGVTTIPRDIVKLKHLVSLDVRRTKVHILHVEVFQLPSLIHLFGKFKLPDIVKPKSEVHEFLSKGKSNLETLAGFITDRSGGFLHLMGYMNKLSKLKILCESPAGCADRTDLKEAIQQFIEDEKQANIGSRSLSLHFSKCCEELLNSLKGPCYLSSLKLHGDLAALPQFVVSLRGLKELCLSSTKLTTGVLEALSNLSYLQYLKLVAHDLDKFIVRDQAFCRLLRLSLELQCPTFPTIEEGALPFLVTLQLLCKDLHGLSDLKIEYLKHLKEVTLDPRVTPTTRRTWEKAAREHPNRPKVLLLKSVDAAQSEIADYTIASEPTECAIQESSIPALLNQGLVASSSVMSKQSTSVLSNMGLSEVSSALT
ncbi:disease resistance protein RGA4-like [Triticum dicoccoides]|uniref:disease resistance protein RGA4-like n=1 Tax=Triticum dicoccoides TaxID=85692 RepID=UPI00188DF4DD|nr:disease resistance protein RGA4-like [Triticum dicoccoides]XP_037421821.1 disease resistance protein RGA4-like [Triticum dicoccoides]